MKIGILTFHAADNYGAVLQAFGLKEVLKNAGHDVSILDYRPKYLTDPYKTMMLCANSSIRTFARALSIAPIRFVTRHRFERFRQDHLNLVPIDRIGEMDLLITGSDQIWNPDLTGKRFDNHFLLDFPELKSRKISYAASAGNCESFKSNLSAATLDALKQLDSISVREQSLGMELKAQGIESITVLDPVLLAGAEIFERLADRSLVPEEPYLLDFSLCNVPAMSETAQMTSKKTGLRYVKCLSMDESITGCKLIQAASVEKFVSLFKYASAVITSSFHGTAFSIMLGKPFLSIGFDTKHSERARNLLESVGLDSRFCMIDCVSSLNMDRSDIETANEMLTKMRSRSYNFVNQYITPPPYFHNQCKISLNYYTFIVGKDRKGMAA